MAKGKFLGMKWRGGSFHAAVRGYVTRKGKRVKSHTRRVTKSATRNAATAVVGKAAFYVLTSSQSWKYKVGSLLILALGGTPPGMQIKTRR